MDDEDSSADIVSIDCLSFEVFARLLFPRVSSLCLE